MLRILWHGPQASFVLATPIGHTYCMLAICLLLTQLAKCKQIKVINKYMQRSSQIDADAAQRAARGVCALESSSLYISSMFQLCWWFAGINGFIHSCLLPLFHSTDQMVSISYHTDLIFLLQEGSLTKKEDK